MSTKLYKIYEDFESACIIANKQGVIEVANEYLRAERNTETSFETFEGAKKFLEENLINVKEIDGNYIEFSDTVEM